MQSAASSRSRRGADRGLVAQRQLVLRAVRAGEVGVAVAVPSVASAVHAAVGSLVQPRDRAALAAVAVLAALQSELPII